jgi:hypothetical protein
MAEEDKRDEQEKKFHMVFYRMPKWSKECMEITRRG